MVVSLVYLSLVHLHRTYFDYGSYTLDITGPLMVITQKVTLLTFSIHDGFARNENELTKSQKFHAIRTLPTALEFFSYVLHFQGLMAGPLVFYKDYMDFIEGTQFLKQNNGNVSWILRIFIAIFILEKKNNLKFLFFIFQFLFSHLCCSPHCCMLSQHLTKVVIKLWSNRHQQRLLSRRSSEVLSVLIYS